MSSHDVDRAEKDAFEGLPATLERDGFALLPQALSPAIQQSLAEGLSDCLLRTDDSGSIRARNGVVYAIRNLLDVFPDVIEVGRETASIRKAVAEILGDNAGLVRGLYFDKPPEQTWSLPWHQDRTVAVVDNQLSSSHFRNPTFKAGIPHLEASDELLNEMVTVRLHLDAANRENGALRVLPGSHRWTAWQEPPSSEFGRLIEVDAGDALLMRPLLAHCSGVSSPECTSGRRVIHLEFAATQQLPDGLRWRAFHPLQTGGSNRA